MISSGKNVLCINLSKQQSEVKSFSDLDPFLGGVGLGAKLLQLYKDDDPVILSVGPLNGYFPFVSKTSVVLQDDDGVEDIYVGGTLSFRIKFSGADAIVLLGKSKNSCVLNIMDDAVTFESNEINAGTLGLPGKRSVLAFNSNNELFLDDYFKLPQDILEAKMTSKALVGVVVTGTKTFSIKTPDKYNELYKTLLSRISDLSVEKNYSPSCSGCPMGCDRSQIGERAGDLLVHSLVACDYAKRIYGDVGTVFSCLNVLGYDYTHEDIEKLPTLIDTTFKELSS
ncbi:MAG: hypothetical protein UX44_C0002G0016 [candidate division WWE3 bacterium GW2011_GWA1_46_21]|uniref:Aldehyde ferredoxin oxidoreductase N-terminal domain-containing protein n=1 Tax=candidate division WWE3 bacterium GW2011_GWA1_46_21 TaxID=1619107 RepID=A0A0G1RPS3_UNCKA|nr:MAG: hypothetical protein UX44_C0002G0016 [candidate division WWE3 bacterium GW2011_GWA1_46_21]